MEILNKFLVIQTAFIGDCILTLPLLQELKKIYSESIIDVVCNPTSAEIFEASTAVDGVIIYDKKKTGKSLKSILNFAHTLRKANYTRIYTLHKSFRSAILTFQTGVKETFGFSNSAFPSVFSNIISYDPALHEVRRLLSFTGNEYEGESWKIMPQIIISSESKAKVDEFTADFQHFAVISPSSVWETKRYPAEKFRELIDHFSDMGITIILSGGEGDKALCDNLMNGKQNVINAAGVFSLIESVYLISKSEFLITNDSAPTHMAMAAGTPVITIFCSTVPEFGFAGYSEKSYSIGVKNLKCRPCGIHGYKECPAGHFKCGYDIDSGEVIRLAEEILNDKKK